MEQLQQCLLLVAFILLLYLLIEPMDNSTDMAERYSGLFVDRMFSLSDAQHYPGSNAQNDLTDIDTKRRSANYGTW